MVQLTLTNSYLDKPQQFFQNVRFVVNNGSVSSRNENLICAPKLDNVPDYEDVAYIG